MVKPEHIGQVEGRLLARVLDSARRWCPVSILDGVPVCERAAETFTARRVLKPVV